MKEIWKPIEGFKNYEVSNLGRVKSLSHYKKGRNKAGKNKGKGKEFFYKSNEIILKGSPICMSRYITYIQVGLREDSKYKVTHVHRLVAKHFIPNPENKPQINHKDGDGTNNHISNLEWVTVSENSLHAYNVLNRVPYARGRVGKLNHRSRAVQQLSMSGKLLKIWDAMADARRSGFDTGSICRCCKGESFTHKGFKWQYD